MLQEIKIRNFKSFRDDAELSFEVSEADPNNSAVVMPDGVQLQRFIVILGANASGKSNILQAIDFLHGFWNYLPHKNDEGIEVQPFLMQPDALSHDTEFDVKLYIEGIRYWYQLTINPEKVCSESLSVYLSNRPTKVFSRSDEHGVSKLYFNGTIAKLSQAEVDVLSISCLKNMSVLAVLKKVNIAVPYLDNMCRWIDTRMMPLQTGATSTLSAATKNKLIEDNDFKEYLMQFAKEADFNITDIKVQKMAALFGHQVETERGEEHYVLPEACQSIGTNRMVELESAIYNLLRCQGLLCIDEIESSLHPNLMEYLLMKFLNQQDNESQLIVTTHYDPILRSINDLFGKDSVWFTEKEKDGNSRLFSLVEFKGLNKLSSIHRAYMNGQFGALPNVIM
jgi:AAA15 family ATPase/GTPase